MEAPRQLRRHAVPDLAAVGIAVHQDDGGPPRRGLTPTGGGQPHVAGVDKELLGKDLRLQGLRSVHGRRFHWSMSRRPCYAKANGAANGRRLFETGWAMSAWIKTKCRKRLKRVFEQPTRNRALAACL